MKFLKSQNPQAVSGSLIIPEQLLVNVFDLRRYQFLKKKIGLKKSAFLYSKNGPRRDQHAHKGYPVKLRCIRPPQSQSGLNNILKISVCADGSQHLHETNLINGCFYTKSLRIFF